MWARVDSSLTATTAAKIRNKNARPETKKKVLKLRKLLKTRSYPTRHSPKAHRCVLPEISKSTMVVIVVKQLGHVIKHGPGPT